MRRKNYKGRCEKKDLSKCKEIVRTYNPIQAVYAEMLQKDKNVKEFKCNVPLDGLEYTSDFVCTKKDGNLMVRECVYSQHIKKPMTQKLLCMSAEYWANRGVTDWGVVINEE